MTHLLEEEDGSKHFGIARYPIDEWKAKGEQVITVKGWVKLCLKIAANDTTNLKGIFSLCKEMEAKL
eukprot:4914760-Prorocentrum_lima.AAC.1